MAGIGVFGVVTAYVAGRGPEFGLRLALGSTPGGLQRFVLKRGWMLAGVGVVLGLAASMSIGQLLEGFLYGIPPFHFQTVAGVAVVMIAVVLVAAFLPAYGASRLNPLDVLRAD